MQKPPRTLGLSLAIITSFLLFTALPLIQVGIVLLLQQRFAQVEVEIGAYGYSYSGGELTGVSEGGVLMLTVRGLGFGLIALMAWRGRPRGIRRILNGAVIMLTLITLFLTLRALLGGGDEVTGWDSGQSLATALLQGRLLLTILIPLYVLWYINRGPARAFFRGYYLPMPEEQRRQADAR